METDESRKTKINCRIEIFQIYQKFRKKKKVREPNLTHEKIFLNHEKLKKIVK